MFSWDDVGILMSNMDANQIYRAWGVIPIHLMELSPGSFRTFVVGTSYQLGNLVSSASSTIESRIGERFPLPPVEKDGKTIERYEYGTVIAIFMGCTFAYVILLTFLGPEYKGRSMSAGKFISSNGKREAADNTAAGKDADLQEAAGLEAFENATHVVQDTSGVHRGDSRDEKV
jgi:SHS family lactate transporter-like MFS transporter